MREDTRNEVLGICGPGIREVFIRARRIGKCYITIPWCKYQWIMIVSIEIFPGIFADFFFCT
jgi:hypothetical protein